VSCIDLSILVPSFNQRAFLPATLDSIHAQVGVDVEVLVLDAGSTDGTVAYLESLEGRPGLWWRSRPDGGVAQAVNEGLARARGRFCAIQSSDDLYLPGALAEALSVLDAAPDVAVAYADAEYIDAQGVPCGRTHVGAYTYEDLLAKRTFVMQSSAVFRTEAARAVGGLRPENAYVCDSELWLRIGRRWPLRHVDAVWSQYRLHGEQRDQQRARIIREWWSMLEGLRPDLSAREWRAARVGGHLTEHRYGDPFGWRRACAPWRALALRPAALSWPEFPRRDLALPLRWLGSRLLRRLGLRRRAVGASREERPVAGTGEGA
jgi:glycosyltransferase involved in cell wall biosynthesis